MATPKQLRRWAGPALALAAACAAAVSSLTIAVPAAPSIATPPALATVAAARQSAAQPSAFDGTVEAVRQSVVAAQVAGTVVALHARAGDRVKAGQLLVRLDARAADQQAAAAAAQVLSARAAQDAATTDVQRQRQLHAQHFISQAALERAEAQYKSASAQAAAQLAAAGAARAESGHFEIRAPYDGVVSEVAVVQGDMAMPGRPLLTLHDPAVLRVSAALPEGVALRLRDASPAPLSIELAGAAPERVVASRWQVLPAADPATHTVVLRLELPPGTRAAPGLFARVWVAGVGDEAAPITVPARAVVQRAELKAVYVIGADGRPLLRQVRVGPAHGDQREILSGLAAGERVALDPETAARVQ